MSTHQHTEECDKAAMVGHFRAYGGSDEWIKSVIGGTSFRFVDGVKQVKFPAVGSVPELIITEAK